MHLSFYRLVVQAWNASGNAHILTGYVLLGALKELLDRQRPDTLPNTSGRFAIVEALKLLFLCGWRGKRLRSAIYRNVPASASEEEGISGEAGREMNFKVGWFSCRSNNHTILGPFAIMSVLAVFYALQEYLTLSLAEVALKKTWYTIIPLSTICIPVILHYCLSRPISLVQFQGALLQSCGFFLLLILGLGSQACISGQSLSLAIFTSVVFALTDHIYSVHHDMSFCTANIPLFMSGTIIHLLAALAVPEARGLTTQIIASALPSFPMFLSYIIEAAAGILRLAVIYYYDASVLGIFWSLVSAVVWTYTSFESFSISLCYGAGILLILFGATTYMTSLKPIERGEYEYVAEQPKASRWKRLSIIVITASSTFAAIATSYHHNFNTAAPHKINQVDRMNETCQRKPLLSRFYYSKPRTYHEFDDILLIVFFSHARYGANLDYYKEVYSEYFPNIVFIGPASREDAGFAHSYDLMVDSYQSDEDLSDPGFYKMAGRMAHHMLYTAMMEHMCYDGYLWAPFDTLLNIPRLQLFDKSKFWYHSPFGHYVPNPAVKYDHHAPAATISPDPSINLTQTWRGWAIDWWWGDPHVGLSVCMPAFEKVPREMRSRMAAFTQGQTRFIGGSADTVFIPGRHRDAFMDILSLFLETNCFLEIAVPTTIHLVIPRDEDILFVDHWWIWEPPFNATFVRQKWDEGYEVDTFHTFHWGEKDENGVWKGNHDHVADVRQLLQESAVRQGVKMT